MNLNSLYMQHILYFFFDDLIVHFLVPAMAEYDETENVLAPGSVIIHSYRMLVKQPLMITLDVNKRLTE